MPIGATIEAGRSAQVYYMSNTRWVIWVIEMQVILIIRIF